MRQERRLEIICKRFAWIEVGRADAANGARLVIYVPGTGASVSLDALGLGALARLRHGDLASWVRADGQWRSRWR
jgi:hypothetical protein